MFSTTDIVELMDGKIESVPNTRYLNTVKLSIGEMAPIVPKGWLEEIILWVHEFTEFSLFLLGKKMNIPEFWNGYPFGTPAHIVTSLVSGQWWGISGTHYCKYCSPEEYADVKGLGWT